jgi:signal transduction histidine kinase
MLEAGAPLAEVAPRLKEAALLAQQEARFAILALSSASGTAPFDAALRRYVEFLTADGTLEVDLEVDTTIRLAPDEQIEVFRIVQEGLANVRKHANATHADVTIGERPFGERYVTITDDGDGFDGDEAPAGQGLKNMRARAESIEGGFSLRSIPGRGTSLEVLPTAQRRRIPRRASRSLCRCAREAPCAVEQSAQELARPARWASTHRGSTG